MPVKGTLARAVPTLQDFLVEQATSSFENGDFKITLTFRPSYAANVENRSEDIRQFLQRANKALLGRRFKPNGRKLKCAYVYEWDACGTAIHFHMALENPVDCDLPQLDRIQLLLDCWMQMRCSGKCAANEIEYIYPVADWIGYMAKRVSNRDGLSADFVNWTLNS